MQLTKIHGRFLIPCTLTGHHKQPDAIGARCVYKQTRLEDKTGWAGVVALGLDI